MINSKKKAFTLIEALIYIGVFGLVVTSFISFSLLTMHIRTRSHTINKVNYDLYAISDFLTDNIRVAEFMASPSKGQSSEALLLGLADGVMTIDLEHGNIHARQGEDDWRLNSEGIVIKDLNFFNFGDSAGKDSIHFVFSVSSVNESDSFRYEQEIQGTANIR